MGYTRELITYLTFKSDNTGLDKADKRIEDTKNKTKQANNDIEQDHRKSLERRERAEEAAKRRADERYKSMRNSVLALTASMTLMTREAIKFEYALKDIEKVNPHLNMGQTKEEILAMSRFAPGKSLTDLARAYKTYAQTLKSQDEIQEMMKLTEQGSIAYDMSAEQTARNLSIIKGNLDLTPEQIRVLGDKISYAHHNYGNAQVPDIFSALQDMSGVMRTAGINETFATAYATLGINAGFEASEVARSMQRLNQRTMMGEMWQNRGMFQTAGKEAGIDMVKFTHELMEASKTGRTGEKWIELFKKIDDAQKKGKNVSAIWSIIGGLNYERIFKSLGSNLGNLIDLNEKLSGKQLRPDGQPVYEGEQKRAYDIIMSTTEKQIQALGNSMQRLSNALMEQNLPAIRELTKIATKYVNAIADNKTMSKAYGVALEAVFGILMLKFIPAFIRKHKLLSSTMNPLNYFAVDKYSLMRLMHKVGLVDVGLARFILVGSRMLGPMMLIAPLLKVIADELGVTDKIMNLLNKVFHFQETPEEKIAKIENEMKYNKQINEDMAKMTPVNLNGITLEGVASGRENWAKSFAGGLMERRYLDAQRMTLIQNVEVNAQYHELSQQTDAYKANQDLIRQLEEKMKQNAQKYSTQITNDQFDRLQTSLGLSN